MTDKTVAEKAGIKNDTAIAVLNEMPGVIESLGLPDDIRIVEPSRAQLIFLFVRDRNELEVQMPPAVAWLQAAGVLWVFFRKGSKAANLDMNRNDIWSIAERMNMRPLGLVSIDDTWSAFRLRRA